ncbi:hypothetical protein D3C87_1588810 [compost metagenome]
MPIQSSLFFSRMSFSGISLVFCSAGVQYSVMVPKAMLPNGSMIAESAFLSRSALIASAILRRMSRMIQNRYAVSVLRVKVVKANSTIPMKNTLGRVNKRKGCRKFISSNAPTTGLPIPGNRPIK